MPEENNLEFPGSENLNEEQNQDENLNENENENVDDQENESSDQESGDEKDYYDSDAEYLKDKGFYDKGLPEDITDLDEAINWFAENKGKPDNQNMSPEAQRLARLDKMAQDKGYLTFEQMLASGDSLNDNQNQFNNFQPARQANDNGQQQIPTNVFTRAVSQLIENGSLTQEESQTFRQLAASFDSALESKFAPYGKAIDDLAKVGRVHDQYISNTNYRFLPKKVREQIPKNVLDGFIGRGLARDYEDAAFQLARANYPDLLPTLLGQGGNQQNSSNNSGNRTFNKPRKRTPPRSKQPKWTEAQQKVINRTASESEMNAMPMEELGAALEHLGIKTK